MEEPSYYFKNCSTTHTGPCMLKATSSIVYEVIRTNSCLFIFFLRKDFKRTKTRQKQTNKTKLSEQKTTKATIFRRRKTSKSVKIVCLHFGAFLAFKIFS